MLPDLLGVAVIVFSVSSMASVGVRHSLGEILGPLRDVRLVALSLAANFVLVPAWAVLLTRLLGLDDPYAVGILLVSTAAGAPFLVKLVQLSDGDVAFAGSLLVLLLPVTVVFMPLVVPVIAPDAAVDVVEIATPLLLTNLAPLAAGIAVLAVLPALARRLGAVLAPLSTAALVTVLGLTVAAHGGDVVGVFGQRAIIAALLLVVGAFGIGFALGVPAHHRDEVGLATAQRNIAAATIVATQSIGDPDTVVTVVVTSTVGMLVLFPLTTQLKKHFGMTPSPHRT